jgi:hypothetical protein
VRLIKIVFFILLLGTRAEAISCELAQLLKDPAIRDNASFWQEFGAKADMGDGELRALMSKYNVHAAERRAAERAPQAPAPASAPRYTLSRQAVKDTRRLASQRPALQRDLDEFLGYAQNGAGYLRRRLLQNGGKWNYKKLEGRYGGATSYSARLDGGVRVVFHQTEDDLVEIIAVDNSTTH